MKVTYYLEKLRNIKSLLIVVTFQGEDGDFREDYENENNNNIHFDVRATHHNLRIRIMTKVNENVLKTLEIPLPSHCKIDPTSLHCQQDPKNSYEDGYIEIKARLIIDASNFDYEASENDIINDHHLISLDTTDKVKLHFKESKESSIYCRCCLNSIVQFDNTTGSEIKVKLLPSSNWIELMDVWLCGCTGVTNFVDFPTGEINSIKDTLFIGDQFLLLHNDNINIQSIKEESISQPISLGSDNWNLWSLVQCKYCDSSIGLHQIQANLNFNYRLFKHQITTSNQPPQNYDSYSLTDINNLYHQYSLETYLSTKILIESRGSMSFKFFIVSITNQQILGLVSLIHWETLLLTNHNNTGNNEFNPILKVLYHPIITNNNNEYSEEDKQLIKKWDIEYQCKYLNFLPDECKTILDILDTSNSMFPTHRKNLNIHTSEFKLAVLRLKY